MKKLLFIYVFLFAAFLFYLYNYHLKEFTASAFGQPQDGLKGKVGEKYVMVTFLAGIDYWKTSLKGFEDAARVLNVSVEYRGATQYDVHEQIAVLEQVIAKKPAGIAISTVNSTALTATINKAIDAGIPVVLFDSDTPSSKVNTFLGTNNYNAGVMAARKMGELLDGKGKVSVVTLLNQLNHQERTEGFLETIYKEYPQIEVVAVKDGRGDQLVSKQAAEEILKQYPDLAGVFTTEANGGVGVGEVVQSMKQEKQIKIMSFDTDKQTLDMVQEGTISATLAQGTWNMGYWSLQFLFQLNHKLVPSQQGGISGASSLPDYVDTGISIVTKENVEDYYAK